MASSYLEVGSEGLTELKNDLTNLSNALHELFELMNADMRQVGEAWRDSKYEEFVSGYKPQIAKCEEISERYAEWCKKVLEPAIDECMAIETTDVGGEGAGSIGVGGVSTDNGTSSSSNGNNDKFAGFNIGIKKTLSSSEKAEKFREASERLKRQDNKNGFKPSDSGFDTPQNERQRLTPEQMAQLFNGRQR